MKILCNRTALARAIANVAGVMHAMEGPMKDEQRKAMFAKIRRGGGYSGGRSAGSQDGKSSGSAMAKAPISGAPGKGIPLPSLPVFRKPNPNSNWGPKDSRGNLIPPPEGSHWESRDGENFYPVPDDPRLIMHPMGAGGSGGSGEEPARGVDASGRVQLPFTGELTPEILSADGGLFFRHNTSPTATPAEVLAGQVQTAEEARARDVFSGLENVPIHFEGMSRYANAAIESVNKSTDYPKEAKAHFVNLLKKYGNPTDAQVRQALQQTDDAFDINSGPGMRTFSINQGSQVSIPALVREFRLGTLPAAKKFSDFGS